MDSRCLVCHRPLKDPESIARNIGPVCFGKSVNGSGELSKDIGQLELDFIEPEPEPVAEEPVVAPLKPLPERYRGKTLKEQHEEAMRIIYRWRYDANDKGESFVDDQEGADSP